MDNNTLKSSLKKHKRALRVRSKLRGSSEKPRLCVVKTNMHIQVQIIDDEKGVTMASISTNSKEVKGTEHSKKNKATAKVLGEKIADKAKALGIEQLIFDRGPHKYHGILAEVAKGLRDKGLQI